MKKFILSLLVEAVIGFIVGATVWVAVFFYSDTLMFTLFTIIVLLELIGFLCSFGMWPDGDCFSAGFFNFDNLVVIVVAIIAGLVGYKKILAIGIWLFTNFF
jgi:hypothetical protein